ncbi:hypothetical protein [Pseudophaeobacter leonis]|uniref:hypothetical protein n=1 Tax=Pseudophaeobacter leonis TaxID=1144477 RepID=UPI00111C5A40|nr:hypothetical protein [Pseudophaeobacter leonis]
MLYWSLLRVMTRYRSAARPWTVSEMAKFILHVGDAKCGSTSIQGSLKQARASLLAKGLVYETGSSGFNHVDLVRLVRPKARGNLEESLVRGKEIVETLRTTLKKDQTVLLSAENFLTLPPEEFLPILRQISPEDPDIKVIAYVRAPTDMYLSFAQQYIKGARHFPQPQHFNRPLDRLLTAWRDFPYVSELRVRPFDRKRLAGGDVTEAFAGVLQDLTGHEIALPQMGRNRTLSDEQMIVLQHLRRSVLPDHDGKLHPISARYIGWFLQLNKVEMIGRKPGLSGAACGAVAKANRGMVARLNTLFPGVDMVLREGDATPWKGGTDVADLLPEYSPEIVSR